MNRLDGAIEAESVAQLRKGAVWFLPEKRPEFAAVTGKYLRFAAAEVVARCDVTRALPLLDELLDHAERNLEAAGDLVARGIATVKCGEYPLPEV
ncbi:MAG: hypothetical protein WEB31_03220 [Chthoniobacterales bacterium]